MLFFFVYISPAGSRLAICRQDEKIRIKKASRPQQRDERHSRGTTLIEDNLPLLSLTQIMRVRTTGHFHPTGSGPFFRRFVFPKALSVTTLSPCGQERVLFPFIAFVYGLTMIIMKLPSVVNGGIMAAKPTAIRIVLSASPGQHYLP
jgi:hypothetical protein